MGVVPVGGCHGGGADAVEKEERVVPLEPREVAGDETLHGVHLGARDALSSVDRSLREREALQSCEREDRQLAPDDPAPQEQTELGQRIAVPFP